MLVKLGKAFVDFFYPPVCVNCKNKVEESNTLCFECRSSLAFARTYRANSVGLEYLDAIIVLARYRGGLQDLLHKVKFEGRRELLKVLADEFSLLWEQFGKEALQNVLSDVSGMDKSVCLIPVPTDEKRFAQRGYDLPESIFKVWSREQNIPFRKCLARAKRTRPQYELDGNERRQNMNGVISAIELPREGVLIVVDDILTTGATLCECARALRVAGAKNKIIIGLALASDMQKPA